MKTFHGASCKCGNMSFCVSAPWQNVSGLCNRTSGWMLYTWFDRAMVTTYAWMLSVFMLASCIIWLYLLFWNIENSSMEWSITHTLFNNKFKLLYLLLLLIHYLSIKTKVFYLKYILIYYEWHQNRELFPNKLFNNWIDF